MTQRPNQTDGGIFGLFFKEWGVFMEEAWKWTEERAAEDRADAQADTERRRTEAAAKLLEQVRLAKEAGVDVEAILSQFKVDRS